MGNLVVARRSCLGRFGAPVVRSANAWAVLAHPLSVAPTPGPFWPTRCPQRQRLGRFGPPVARSANAWAILAHPLPVAPTPGLFWPTRCP